MWARWALAIVVAAAVIAAIVIAVNRAGPEGSTSEAGAEAEVNRIADVAISEDEAPHFAGLSPGSSPTSALERAISADVRRRIAAGQLTGPLEGISCHSARTPSGGHHSYRCSVRSAGIAYPFVAVLDERQGRLAWCKIDRSPVPHVGAEIPISKSCRA